MHLHRAVADGEPTRQHGRTELADQHREGRPGVARRQRDVIEAQRRAQVAAAAAGPGSCRSSSEDRRPARVNVRASR